MSSVLAGAFSVWRSKIITSTSIICLGSAVDSILLLILLAASVELCLKLTCACKVCPLSVFVVLYYLAVSILLPIICGYRILDAISGHSVDIYFAQAIVPLINRIIFSYAARLWKDTLHLFSFLSMFMAMVHCA